jgi:Protein of unknown function (DUF3892)
MALRITHVRLSGTEPLNENITHYKWVSDANANTGENTKAAMVEWIDMKKGHAYVGVGSNKAAVGVVKSPGLLPYLRTYADGAWNNNLLSLPRF